MEVLVKIVLSCLWLAHGIWGWGLTVGQFQNKGKWKEGEPDTGGFVTWPLTFRKGASSVIGGPGAAARGAAANPGKPGRSTEADRSCLC